MVLLYMNSIMKIRSPGGAGLAYASSSGTKGIVIREIGICLGPAEMPMQGPITKKLDTIICMYYVEICNIFFL